jgi:hypothetical protein
METYGGVHVLIHVFLTSAIWKWVMSFKPRPLHHRRKSPPGLPIGQEAAWTPKPVWTTWREEKSSPYRYSNSDPLVVQPIASRYIDCAIPARPLYWININFACNYSVLALTYWDRRDVNEEITKASDSLFTPITHKLNMADILFTIAYKLSTVREHYIGKSDTSNFTQTTLGFLLSFFLNYVYNRF